MAYRKEKFSHFNDISALVKKEDWDAFVVRESLGELSDEGKKLELGGTYYFANKNFELLLENIGAKHGFDAILIDDCDSIFFLESKYKEDGKLQEQIKSAMKTIKNPSQVRIQTIRSTNSLLITSEKNALTNLTIDLSYGRQKVHTVRNRDNFKKTIEKLDQIAKEIEYKKPELTISKDEMILVLGHKKPINLSSVSNSKTTPHNVADFKEVLHVEIESF